MFTPVYTTMNFQMSISTALLLTASSHFSSPRSLDSSSEYQYDSKAFLLSRVNKPGWVPVKLPQTGTLQGEHCCRRFAVLEDSLNSQCLSFSNNSSLFTIHVWKSGSPLFNSTLRALTEWFTEWFVEKGKRPNILMRNSLKDKKLLEKITYTGVNCLRVFGFYISNFLFVSTAGSKLNFKHRAGMQKYSSGNLGDALLSATDFIYNKHIQYTAAHRFSL